MATTTDRPAWLERAVATSKVDPADEPSVGWGWHGEPRKSFQVVGWFFVLSLLTLLVGNHPGRVEDVYVVGFAALGAVLLVFYFFQSKKVRRR